MVCAKAFLGPPLSLSPEDSPRIRNRESPHAHEPRTNNRVLALEYIHARASARAQSHLPRCSFSILAYRLGREELLLNRESRALVTHPLLDIRALRNCERRRRRVCINTHVNQRACADTRSRGLWLFAEVSRVCG